MKVYILDTGWFEGDENWFVALSIFGTKENKNPMTKWTKYPVFAVLIDHPDGKILFDTGNNHKDVFHKSERFPFYCNEEQDIVKQLALIGTKPEDIKTVILSHMHHDHAGNLHLFKHADVYVHQTDFEYGQILVHKTADPKDHTPYNREDLEVPVQKFHFINDDFEFAKGIEVITLPGHSPGVLGLVVKLDKDGVLIFPSDAIYTHKNFGPPAKPPVIIYDNISYIQSVEKVRSLVEKYNAKVMFSHDIDTFEAMKHSPKYYE